MAFNLDSIKTPSCNIDQNIEEAYKQNADNLIKELNVIFNECTQTNNRRFVFWDKFTQNLIHIQDLNNDLYYSYGNYRVRFAQAVFPYISEHIKLPLNCKFHIPSILYNEIPLRPVDGNIKENIFMRVINTQNVYIDFDAILKYMDFLCKKCHYTTKRRIQNKIKFIWYIGTQYNIKNASEIKPFLLTLYDKIQNEYIIPKNKIVWQSFGDLLLHTVIAKYHDEKIWYYNLLCEMGEVSSNMRYEYPYF